LLSIFVTLVPFTSATVTLELDASAPFDDHWIALAIFAAGFVAPSR
jgi:hypothetical protein